MFRFARKLLVAALLLTVVPIAAGAAPPVLDPLSTRLANSLVADGEVPALMIGLIDRGERASFAFGKLSAARPVPPDDRTVFQIGSVTKTFTGLLLADAVRRGELALEATLPEVLKDWPLPAGGPRPITLLDLATQTSALPRLPANLQVARPLDPYRDYTRADLRRFLGDYRLPRAPGARYEYSNLGYAVLGQALAERSGRSYGELIAERVAGPLGLKQTAASLSAEQRDRAAPGHNAAGAAVPDWQLGVFAGAGVLYSSTWDLLTYLQAHLQPEQAPAALREPLAQVQRPRRDTDQPGGKIGLGWHVQQVRGQEVVWHNGMTGGFAAFVGFTRDGRRGAVVLANAQRDVTALGFDVLVPRPDSPAQQAGGKLDPAVLQAYVGRYRLAPGFELDVRERNGRLIVQATGQGPLTLAPAAPDEFAVQEVEARLVFKRDDQGRVTAVVLHQNGREAPGPRL